ncbi:hypothetical protein PENANT_c001G06256 [Penicillium antarcticum]|uniref:Transcription factor domain-containing protein n=1 Tax=Penicillium antarcticum TaxID=416450 RepID=A0A1V6QN39_9EURO|nr:hypothetical protein PENANT_c001G06256 [Penicillium antarcticum]
MSSTANSHLDTSLNQDGLSTSVLQTVVSNNNDAMNILFEAALQESNNTTQMTTAERSRSIAPELTDADILRVWNACRFVKMGWFSAQEAMVLVDLDIRFFENMAPLSPVLTDFFASHKNQYYLVTQEPMLCYTILMISSRYHTLPGVGSVEALLLMSEWHPRVLQFPPETDGWDSDFLMTNPDIRDPPNLNGEIPVSSRWREDVVEPTKRFERMSWMVLNSALALAHELGVFDSSARLARQDDLVGLDAERYLEHLQSVDRDWLLFMTAWIELMKLTSSVTDTLFPLMNISSSTGSSDTFIPVLERKQFLLASWQQRYLNISDSSFPYTDTLFIEYQHLRILTNSIGMQRIVQRVLQNQTQPPSRRDSIIDFSFIERARQLNITAREYGFIEEVIDGCCQTLDKITLLRGSFHFSPMRILFRTISASIFLMKALALGVRNSKLQEALQILDRAIVTLQDGNQDDVHLKSRYAALLQVQVSRLRESLVSLYGIGCDLPSPDSYENIPGMDLGGFSDATMNDWLSLPLDPSMAPFGSAEGDFGVRLDGVDLDLDFLWQLPP